MRIGVNTRELLKNRMEGIARYIYHTTQEMVLAHPEDEFFFFFDRPYNEEFIFADNVTPIVIGPQARHPFLYIFWFEWSLSKALNKYNIDVLYSGDSFMSLKTSVPTVIVSHDLAYRHYPEHISKVNQWYYGKYMERFHQKAHKIIAVSNATKKDIIEQYGTSPDKILVAFNDTDGGFSKLDNQQKILLRKKYSAGKPYFLYLGSLHPRKNIINLIKSFELFKQQTDTDHQLLLLGRKAWGNNEMEICYNNSAFKEDIRFLGVMDIGRELVLGAAEALVYVSLFEGFGVPILEAMDAGVPIVCSDVSSMPEVGGEAAILVNPQDIQSISDAMSAIVNDKSLVTTLLEKVAEHRQKFNWKDSSEIIYTALQQSIRDIKN